MGSVFIYPAGRAGRAERSAADLFTFGANNLTQQFAPFKIFSGAFTCFDCCASQLYILEAGHELAAEATLNIWTRGIFFSPSDLCSSAVSRPLRRDSSARPFYTKSRRPRYIYIYIKILLFKLELLGKREKKKKTCPSDRSNKSSALKAAHFPSASASLFMRNRPKLITGI